MPVHHLHDGPPELFSGFNTKPAPRKRPTASLAALQWAADRANTSYGRFTLSLTEEDQRSIQTEYEQFLSRRKEAMAARVATDKPCHTATGE